MLAANDLERQTPYGEALLVDVNTAGRIIGISRTEIYREMGRGSIRSVKVGRRRLIARAELVRWVAAQCANDADK